MTRPTGTWGSLSPPPVPKHCWELTFLAAVFLQSCSGSTRTLSGVRS